MKKALFPSLLLLMLLSGCYKIDWLGYERMLERNSGVWNISRYHQYVEGPDSSYEVIDTSDCGIWCFYRDPNLVNVHSLWLDYTVNGIHYQEDWGVSVSLQEITFISSSIFTDINWEVIKNTPQHQRLQNRMAYSSGSELVTEIDLDFCSNCDPPM